MRFYYGAMRRGNRFVPAVIDEYGNVVYQGGYAFKTSAMPVCAAQTWVTQNLQPNRKPDDEFVPFPEPQAKESR
jgi:hypothetical protein